MPTNPSLTYFSPMRVAVLRCSVVRGEPIVRLPFDRWWPRHSGQKKDDMEVTPQNVKKTGRQRP
jgi:hypothetical protein